MIQPRQLILFAVYLTRVCFGQQSGWVPNQVNTTMCQWDSPGAAVVRDTLYLDGGYLWWQPGMADGSLGGVISDGNPLGLVYLLNFNTSFKTSDNISSIFTTLSKAAGGGNANNIAPQYYNEGMFGNDYQWFTYGGRVGLTEAFQAPAADSIAKYLKYQSGPPRQFQSGWQLDRLPANITRYISSGASASVPSENLGFYFGGLRSSSWGPIYNIPGNASQQSLTMIEVNMTVQLQETWTNSTLPTNVPGRTGAELVWVPVSEQGVLIAIGGVVFPADATVAQKNNASATAESQRISPGFMSTVAVYDIARQIWYEQSTSGNGPGQLTQGCTVLASAQDGTSHNIYWYGGYDGLNLQAPDSFNDDVWVLSIPSFTWMKVKPGTISHARAGHRCVKPYPDQMLVIGGFSALSGGSFECVQDGIIQIFNLSSAEWLTSYDPKLWSEYSVPSTIYKTIGGSATGGATQVKPSGGNFSDGSMTSLFGTPYNTTKIKKWYPYEVKEVDGNNRTTLLPQPEHKSGTPSYLAPVLGVVLGLFFITLVVLGVLLYRRRKFLKLNGTATQSEAGTMDNRRWVTTWLRGTPVDAKAPTITTDETPMSAYEEEHQTYVRPAVPEMGDGQVHEMADTSRPVELHDTGFVPVLKLGKDRSGLASSPSVTSHTSHASRTSTVSRVSQASAGRIGVSPVGSPRADSPDFESEQQQRRIVSDMSGISESDRGHLRGISETSVSTVGGYATPMEGLGIHSRTAGDAAPEAVSPEGRPGLVSPLTPPEALQTSGDYLGATVGNPSTPTTRRKSNFSEGLDETEGR